VDQTSCGRRRDLPANGCVTPVEGCFLEIQFARRLSSEIQAAAQHRNEKQPSAKPLAAQPPDAFADRST
jgi:hypothetical protein